MYSLRELTIIWHLYGGHDFSAHPSSTASPPAMAVKKSAAAASVKSKKLAGGAAGVGSKVTKQQEWKCVGGIGRDYNTLVEIELNKVSSCSLSLSLTLFLSLSL